MTGLDHAICLVQYEKLELFDLPCKCVVLQVYEHNRDLWFAKALLLGS